MRAIRGRTMVARGPDLFELSDVARVIWDACDRTTTYGALADRLAAEFEVSGDEALADVEEFVENLRSRGFVEPRPGD